MTTLPFCAAAGADIAADLGQLVDGHEHPVRARVLQVEVVARDPGDRLGVKPGECLVIEDAPAGIEAAHAGGMKVIALSSTYGVADLKQANAVVTSLTQIQISPDGTGPGSILKVSIR